MFRQAELDLLKEQYKKRKDEYLGWQKTKSPEELIKIRDNEIAKLLASKNPAEYIDNSFLSMLPSGQIHKFTSQWLKENNFTLDDLEYARSHHYYWRLKKMEHCDVRNKNRNKKHSYGKPGRMSKNEEFIAQFISLNGKRKNGTYKYRDWEIAKDMGLTIYGVQHLRRKYNLVAKIYEKQSKQMNKRGAVQMMKNSEGTLRKEFNAI